MPLLSSGVMACREAVERDELLRERGVFSRELGQRKKQTSSSPWMGHAAHLPLQDSSMEAVRACRRPWAPNRRI